MGYSVSIDPITPGYFWQLVDFTKVRRFFTLGFSKAGLLLSKSFTAGPGYATDFKFISITISF